MTVQTETETNMELLQINVHLDAAEDLGLRAESVDDSNT